MPGRSHCFMYWTFRSFRLQSPSVASITWPVFFCDRTYRRGRSEERAPSVCTDMLASVGLRHRGCGLAVNGRPYRVRHPTDRSFTSWCSPPPLTRTQFRSVTAARPATDRDSHPADSIHSQSHSPPARAGADGGPLGETGPREPRVAPTRCGPSVLRIRASGSRDVVEPAVPPASAGGLL